MKRDSNPLRDDADARRSVNSRHLRLHVRREAGIRQRRTSGFNFPPPDHRFAPRLSTLTPLVQFVNHARK